MRIKDVSPFILHVPLEATSISDSTHTITHWGVVGVRIETEDGLSGFGFTGTHAHVDSDRLITQCIESCYRPLLIREDASDIDRLWVKLNRHPPLQWIGRTGITQLALAAVDIALWDLKAKRSRLPLWAMLGGATAERLTAYNTDVGWLSIPDDDLVDGCRRAVAEDGFRGVKIKVGSNDPGRDLKRMELVRKAVGPDVTLAIDGNGRWDLPTCIRFCRRAEDLDIFWFEEPLWYDDVAGHAELARSSSIPIALGEQLYTIDAFQAFFAARALHFVQPDVTRLGGITEYVQVAHAAHALRLPVVAHAGDMSQIHVHLAHWHPASRMLEFIPWIRHAFEDPIRVADGNFSLPERPGAGSTPTQEAFTRYAKPLR